MAEVIFIGDSLIEYHDWAGCFPRHRVYNLGRSGETVAELRQRLGSVLPRLKAPEWIFIMSGTNNVAMEDLDFIADYREIIAKFRDVFPTARLVIHSLPPILLPWFNPALIDRANVQLRALAQESGSGFIDVNAIFEQAGSGNCLVADGVHISDRGYQLWAAAVEAEIG